MAGSVAAVLPPAVFDVSTLWATLSCRCIKAELAPPPLVVLAIILPPIRLPLAAVGPADARTAPRTPPLEPTVRLPANDDAAP